MVLPSILIYLPLLLPFVSSFTFQPASISRRQCANNCHASCKSSKHKLLPIATTRLHASNLNKDGKCKFGTKEYWDTMYNKDDNNSSSSSDNNTKKNEDGLSAEEYSWYCDYTELQPFWDTLVVDSTNKKEQIQVLIAGIGNDITPIQMYDDGWTNMIAFDYSESGVYRAKELFGPTRLRQDDDTNTKTDGTATTGSGARLLVADCRELPIPSGTIDATLDKGTLGAIYITGKDVFSDSVKELTRVTAVNGIIVCVSAVIPQEDLLNAFQNEGGDDCCWETVLDGGLAFADSGEATIDLGANLYSFRRR
jgi:hypothetical protein